MQPVEAEHRRQPPLAHRRQVHQPHLARSSARTPATPSPSRAQREARSAAARTPRRAAAPAAPRPARRPTASISCATSAADVSSTSRTRYGARPPGAWSRSHRHHPPRRRAQRLRPEPVGLAVHLLLPGVVARAEARATPAAAPAAGASSRRQLSAGPPTPRARRAPRCRTSCRRPGRAPRRRGAAGRADRSAAGARVAVADSPEPRHRTLDRRGRSRDTSSPDLPPEPGHRAHARVNLTLRRARDEAHGASPWII